MPERAGLRERRARLTGGLDPVYYYSILRYSLILLLLEHTTIVFECTNTVLLLLEFTTIVFYGTNTVLLLLEYSTIVFYGTNTVLLLLEYTSATAEADSTQVSSIELGVQLYPPSHTTILLLYYCIS